jgi:putative transposase
VKFAFIQSMDADERRKPRRQRIPVSLMCEVLDVSRAGYYAWLKRPPAPRVDSDAELTELITHIHAEHKGRLGIDRMVTELAKLGHAHSAKRVRRLVRAAGLTCVHPKPYKTTTIRDADASGDGLVDLVDRDFVPEGPDQLWFTDITYIHTGTGWAYLATIMDGYSRKVVGWDIAAHMRTELVTNAFTMAIDRRRPPIGQTIIHSDRGSQYTSHEFRALALANGIIPSVGHTGICYDNAPAESFNATIKKELIHQHAWLNPKQVKHATFEYIEIYYNRKRPHTKIGGLSPHEYELHTHTKFDKEPHQTA